MRKLLLLIPLIFMIAACGERVEVPPAYIGKILTKNGYKPESVPPSKFRLDWCWAYCDRLVLVEVSDKGIKEEFKLFMPKDQLNVHFDLRLTMSVRSNTASVDSIFARVPAAAGDYITFTQVYETYARPIIRETTRTVMADYSINEIASSRSAVNAKVAKALREALKATPIDVKRIALADVQFPKIIVDQKEAAYERKIAIEKEEAQKQVELVKLQTELEKAKMSRAIRREKAEAIREENNILAASVTDKYLQYKKLEVLETMASNPNTVFIPYGALDEVGVSQRMFNSQKGK